MTDDSREPLLAQAALGFSHPRNPVTLEVVVGAEARERITAFAELFSQRAGNNVSEGGVIEYAIDMLWSRWMNESR